MQTPVIRPGTPADSYAVFLVFEQAMADLVRRWKPNARLSIDSPESLARAWRERESLFRHLARTAHQFWVAEQAGQVVGYARSILRDGLWELTELFILPDHQSSGLGRGLLAPCLPVDGVRQRAIIASPDLRALALYMKTGVYPRCPTVYLWRAPQVVAVESDLEFEPVQKSPQLLEELARLDQAILGHRRDVDQAWLLGDRQGYLYRRHGQVVGYGYLGENDGPFALLDPADFPAVLAHAETQAAQAGRHEFGLEVPTINATAVDHLLGRGCRMDSLLAYLMSDRPLGQFDRYLVTVPPFFL